MEPFKTFKAIAVPIDIPNCDTDQIIPVRFVRMARTEPDYPSYFLHDLRFDADGTRRSSFSTNRRSARPRLWSRT